MILNCLLAHEIVFLNLHFWYSPSDSAAECLIMMSLVKLQKWETTSFFNA